MVSITFNILIIYGTKIPWVYFWPVVELYMFQINMNMYFIFFCKAETRQQLFYNSRLQVNIVYLLSLLQAKPPTHGQEHV